MKKKSSPKAYAEVCVTFSTELQERDSEFSFFLFRATKLGIKGLTVAELVGRRDGGLDTDFESRTRHRQRTPTRTAETLGREGSTAGKLKFAGVVFDSRR